MAKNVTINGVTYTLNEQGDPQPWGDDLSELLQALADVASNTAATGDILMTSFTIDNNVSSVRNVTQLLFDPTVTRAAIINYSIYRSTDTNEASESGVILLTYKTIASTWEIAQYSVGDGGVTLTITNAGQFQYVSDNMAGTGHVGTLKFTAKAFSQT